MKNSVISYSGGKDSTLALYKAMEAGYKVNTLIVTYNGNGDRSWIHGTPKDILEKISSSIGIPLQLVKTDFWKDDYAIDLEKALKEAKVDGNDTCIFGDIDIEENRKWCEERCTNANIKSEFPLWHRNRADNAKDLVKVGFKAIITVVDTKQLNPRFLGKTLTMEVLEDIAKTGADMCGENGEYHTVVFDGPIFKEPIDLKIGQKVELGNGYIVLDVY